MAEPAVEINSESEPLLSQTSFPDPDAIENQHLQELTTPPFWTFFSSTNAAYRARLIRSFKIRARYYIPIFGWLPNYEIEKLQYDIIAGLTVAFLIIPQSLSYAQALVNVPPVLGLYSAFITQFVYSILGTSRQLAVGPEALVSILVGSCIKEFTQWRDANPASAVASYDPTIPPIIPVDPYINIQPTALLCLLVGLFTFLLGFFRLGFLDSVLSRALLRGFVLAVACVVMIDMTPTLLGLKMPDGQCLDRLNTFPVSAFSPTENPDPESPFQTLYEIITHLGNSHFLTTTLSVTSIVFLLGVKWVKKRYQSNKTLQILPEILVLVVMSTFLTWMCRWDCEGVAILNMKEGTLPKDVQTYPMPTAGKIKHLLLSAILISVIGFVESIVVAKTYSAKHRYGVSPNRELVAMGVGNIVSSLFGGFPSYGSLGRSAVNDAAGAQTQLSGFVTGLVVFMTAKWFLPLFQFLPKAVCSSIIVVAALKLIELEEVYFLVKLFAWQDLGLLLMTFTSTIFISIETGTLLSVGVSLLLVVKHTTTTRLVLLGQTTIQDPATGLTRPKFKNIKDPDFEGQITRIDGILLIRFEEGMFFGNVGQLTERLKRIEIHGDLGIHPGEEPRNVTPIIPAATATAATRGREPPAESNIMQEENGWEDQTLQVSPSRAGPANKLYGVVFDMKSVSDIDASATQTMVEIVHEYSQRNVMVCIVKLRAECKKLFQRSGLVDSVGPENFYSKIQDAVHAINNGRSLPEVVVERVPSSSSKGSALPFRKKLLQSAPPYEEFSSLPFNPPS